MSNDGETKTDKRDDVLSAIIQEFELHNIHTIERRNDNFFICHKHEYVVNVMIMRSFIAVLDLHKGSEYPAKTFEIAEPTSIDRLIEHINKLAGPPKPTVHLTFQYWIG